MQTVVTDMNIAQATAQRMGLPKPRRVEKYRVRAGQDVTGISVQLPGWMKPVVFEEGTGRAQFDNYSPFSENHPMVRSGQKQAGEQGRWGDIRELNRFIAEYVATGHWMTADEQGHTVEECKWNPETQQLDMRIST